MSIPLPALLACISATFADPRFTAEFRKKEDRFAILTPQSGGEELRIRSASGIGGAKITCRDGEWPQSITLVFAGLKSLEHLGLKGNGVTLEGRLGFDAKPATFYFDPAGKPLAEEKGSAYRVKLDRRKDEGIRVTLTTPAAARTTKTWELDWIDAYR